MNTKLLLWICLIGPIFMSLHFRVLYDLLKLIDPGHPTAEAILCLSVCLWGYGFVAFQIVERGDR